MSSTILNAIHMVENDKHAVGTLNNWSKDLVNLGAVVDEDTMDNWEVVELGFDANGERICKSLTDESKKGYLIASVEDYMGEYETMSNFYNVRGERARIVAQPVNNRFETSKFKLADLTKQVKNGQHVHYNITDKVFLISNGAADDAGYAGAGNKYVVVDAVGNSLCGQQTIRFEIVQ